jgi:hypothetical protein
MNLAALAWFVFSWRNSTEAAMKQIIITIALLLSAAFVHAGDGLCPIRLNGLTMKEFAQQSDCLEKNIERQLRQHGWAKVYYVQACRAEIQVVEYTACRYYNLWWEVEISADGRGKYIRIWYGGRTP